MRITPAKIGMVLGGLLVMAGPGFAQEEMVLDPLAEEGQQIFQETAGGVGCAYCHGDDALGDIGPNIRGQDPVVIMQALNAIPDMAFIDLSQDDVDAVAAYLRYLHEAEMH